MITVNPKSWRRTHRVHRGAEGKPRQVLFASSGVGSINHMLGESFQAYSGTKLIHIPYKGSGPAMQDVMGGQVDILFDQFPRRRTHRHREVKAVAPSRRKIPGIPTCDHGRRGHEGFHRRGVVWASGAGQGVARGVAKLTDAMRRPWRARSCARSSSRSARAVGSSPAEFTAQVRSEIAHEAGRQGPQHQAAKRGPPDAHYPVPRAVPCPHSSRPKFAHNPIRPSR